MVLLDLKEAEAWESALISVIKKEIGSPAVDLVKDRLLEKYGTTLRQSFQKWEIVEDILRENFGEGYVSINSKFLSKIAKINSKYDQNFLDLENQDEILKVIGDPEVGAMLDQVLDDSKIIKDIINGSKVPQTTAYRKIEKMKQLGLLVENGFIISQTKKKIVKYTSPFKSFSIVHESGKSKVNYGQKKFLVSNLK